MPREARARAARNRRRCAGTNPPLADGLQSGQWHVRDLVEPVDADDLLDQIGFAVDVGTPGRHLGNDGITGFGDGKAERLQHRQLLGRFDLHPGKSLTRSSRRGA
jgi:hypothetical protein